MNCWLLSEDLKKNDENENRSIKSVISTINKKYFKDDLECFKEALTVLTKIS
jgi:hypothetical protein